MSAKITLLLVGFATTTVTGQWTCPADIPLLHQEGAYAACFYISPDGVYKDYDSAKADCITRGGILAEPRSLHVDQFIASHINSLSSPSTFYFVGANDVAEEGTWRYESDGDLLGYTNWPPGAPDNADINGFNEHCLSYFPTLQSGAVWNDVICNYPSGYICQYGPKVDGGWSKYVPSECSTTCGEGTKTRVRTCTNPAPAFGGASCAGSDTALSACDNPACSDACSANPCLNDGTCTVINNTTRECACLVGYNRPDCEECSCWASDDCGGAICPIILAVFVVLIVVAVVIAGIVMCRMARVKKGQKKKRPRKQFLE